MRKDYPELNRKGIVYAFQYALDEERQYVLEDGRKVTFKPGQVLYVGIDTTENFERYENHMKPSKRNDTKNSFHAWLHDNKADWIWLRIMEISGFDEEDVKKSVHAVETELTKTYEPFFALLKNNF